MAKKDITIRKNRCYDSVAHGKWKAVTMLSAIRSDASTETMVYEGSTDKVIFENYIEHFLLPTLKNDDIVILDNLSSHKGKKSKSLLKAKVQKYCICHPISRLKPYRKDVE